MTLKLQKILAQAGLGSRREIERWIQDGRVRVNQKIAQIGDRASESDLIEVDNQPVRFQKSTSILLMYHKPVGQLCTHKDTEGRPTVFDALPPPPSGKWISIGRLDYNTSGLLLMTNNGTLAHQLMHPTFHVQRTYQVRLYGKITPSRVKCLMEGVHFPEGVVRFDSLHLLRTHRHNHWYEVTISVGINRIVRRLWESQGVQVNRLIRTGFGSLILPDHLTAGNFEVLESVDIYGPKP